MGCAVVFAISAGMGCSRPASGNVSPSLAAAASAGVPPAAQEGGATTALDTRTWGWAAGKRYVYRLKLTSSLSFGDGPNVFDFDLDGKVLIATVKTTANTAQLLMTMRDAHIVSRIPESQPELDKVALQLQDTNCFLTLSGGRVSEMHVAKGSLAIAVNTYREIGARLQFARSSPEKERYTADEYDTTGQYLASYERDGAPGGWRKRKERYLEILAAKAAAPNSPTRMVPQVVLSQGDIRLLPDGRPDAVHGHDEVLVNGAQAPVRSSTTVSLEGASMDDAPQETVDWNALLAKTERIGADEPYGGEASVEALDEARIHGLTFDGIVDRLEQLAGPTEKAKKPPQAANEEGEGEKARLFIALAATFRRKPETVPLAVQKIRAKSSAAEVLISALGSASSPASQKALVDLMASKTLDPVLHRHAVLSLLRTPMPSADAVDALTTLLVDHPFSMEAIYGLGTFSRRLRDAGNDEQSKVIGELLLERLALTENIPSRLVTVLGGITNSGYAGALPRVIPYLTDPRDSVRAAAVRALQSMRDPKVDPLIAASLEADPSSEVRLSALDAARVRQPSDALVGSLVSAALHASDPQIRFRAVELIVQWVPQRLELRSTLEKIAENDAEERVREHAKAAL